MNVVEFKDVVRDYPLGVTALKGVTLNIPERTVFGLLGRNGSGKTTMLRMIPALLHPTAGTVRVFGEDPWDKQEEVKRQMGYLSENEVLPSNIRIRDIIDLSASLYPTWDKKMADDLASQFKLESKRKIGTLSKGQKRQVGLICAVSHRPRLLVLDEPAGGLDPVVRRDFLEVVIELLAEAGSTVLLSSHLMGDIERVAQHVGILHEGRLLFERPLDELKENFCRVELRGEGLETEALSAQSKCVRASQNNGRMTATLECAAEEAENFIRAILPPDKNIEIIRTVSLSLEDIFIELTGDHR